jgi:ribosomal protein L22
MTDEEKQPTEGAEPEEKPKRTRRRKPAAESAEVQSAEVQAEASEEAPKPRRTRRKKAEEPVAEATEEAAEAQEEAAEAETPVAAEDEPQAEEPEEAEEEEEAKPRRGRRRSSETAAPESAPAPVHRTSPAPRLDDGTIVVRAQAKYVRCAPRKARLVVDHIRGKSVGDARAILTHTPRAAAQDVLKLLESAVANAENNHELDADDLVIRKVYVDEGPTLKRYRPRALGRATRIRKRTSHMTIQLSPKE